MLRLVVVIMSIINFHELPKGETAFSHKDAQDPVEKIDLKGIKEIEEFIKVIRHEVESTTKLDSKAYCSTFRTCFECVKSIFYSCKWCHDLGCTDIEEELCPSTSKPINECPYITHQGAIYTPSGIRSHITVQLHISDPKIYDTDMICQIKLKNRVTHLKGLIVNNTVYCHPTKLDAGESKDKVFGSFRLIWGGVDPYSNEVPVIVYDCGMLADDCDSCRELALEYGCGWCDKKSSCVVANKCKDIMNWSLNKLKCQFRRMKMYFV